MNLFTPMRQTTNTGIFSASFRSPSAFAKTKDARGILQIATKAYSNAAEAMGKGNELAELNASLQMLAILFPNIQYGVLREMLDNFSGDSRLEVVIEQLLKHQDRYVNGRWRNPTHECSQQGASTSNQRTFVALEDSFRNDSYKAAAKRALSLEFKGLSRSTIEAVLAERNFSYTLSRPTLQGIASKTWRRHISTLFMRWRNPARHDPECHFMLSCVRKEGTTGPSEPMLKPTGDAELDHELYTTVLAPFLLEQKKKQSADDLLLAVNMNAKEAEDAGAVYECECCFSDTDFEHMSACTEAGVETLTTNVVKSGALHRLLEKAVLGVFQSLPCNEQCAREGLARKSGANSGHASQNRIFSKPKYLLFGVHSVRTPNTMIFTFLLPASSTDSTSQNL
ncbi:hypothetical protein G7Y79_00019g047740 [Physcia stellaris]|nr:hypothetical protein G7Y79_00019g047740 [Physcia stellaris]